MLMRCVCAAYFCCGLHAWPVVAAALQACILCGPARLLFVGVAFY